MPGANAGRAKGGRYRLQELRQPQAIAGAGQILHGTYSKKSPYNTCTPEGVDEYTSWGDYFYMEALTRMSKDWELYW